VSEREDSGFMSRWSRRKVQARQGVALEERIEPPLAAPPPAPAAVAVPAATTLPAQSVDTTAPPSGTAPSEATPPKPAPPTLADVAALTRESDFSRFVAPGVDGNVKNAALKKLFGDPHFNVMDGLDTYIDDYNKPDPLPLASIRKMAQAAFLGLVEATPPAAASTLAAGDPDPTPATTAPTTARAPKSAQVDAAADAAATPDPDEDTDLRLQPHDAAGCGGAEDGAAADRPRQS
jgi:hypothetical protein